MMLIAISGVNTLRIRESCSFWDVILRMIRARAPKLTHTRRTPDSLQGRTQLGPGEKQTDAVESMLQACVIHKGPQKAHVLSQVASRASPATARTETPDQQLSIHVFAQATLDADLAFLHTTQREGLQMQAQSSLNLDLPRTPSLAEGAAGPFRTDFSRSGHSLTDRWPQLCIAPRC